MAGELGFRAWITTSAFLKVCTILAAFVVHAKGGARGCAERSPQARGENRGYSRPLKYLYLSIGPELIEREAQRSWMLHDLKNSFMGEVRTTQVAAITPPHLQTVVVVVVVVVAAVKAVVGVGTRVGVVAARAAASLAQRVLPNGGCEPYITPL